MVRIVSRLMMPGDTGDGDWSPVAKAARSQTGGFRCCGWLYCVTRGGGELVAPPISERGRKVLQVTGSLLTLIIVCCCIALCLRSDCESLRVKELLPGPLFQLVCLINNTQRTVTVYRISGAMASGDCRPKADQSGISYRFLGMRLRPGVVVLDTSAVPDVIGRGTDTGATWESPEQCSGPYTGRQSGSMGGFHDVTLVDMAGVTGPSVSREELSALRWQWPISLVIGCQKDRLIWS